ncbi:MFS transporter [Leptolyngbya sp. CCNP1308]|uniref:MFS transporter n=1 Tax=Leptolyngbya sp. CCNP1308 TaxID=3110255 RepID=UPI002B1FFE43|nr:MFS transporter [Leptolyngbya sp. CCNP1308]MEA5447022.1 MFS transporter [Leptolyngbya sp. CCNP1308]
MVSEPPSLRLLVTMNLGFWGVQIGNGLQTAHASAVFESLGAEASQLPLLWLGAPVMGLLAQPIVGELSDRTVSRWGQRQPYFLGGALLGAVMLLALPLSTDLAQAVAFYWVLQLALNISVAPSRPFVGDLLAQPHRTLGYALQGFCIGLGTICAAGLPWLLEHLFQLEPAAEIGIPAVIKGAYWAGAVLCLLGTLATFWTVNEPAIQERATADLAMGDRPSLLGAIAQAMAALPPIMRQLALVQALSWAGIYCIFLYLPNAIALNVLGAPNRQSPDYVHGIEWAGLCIAFYNLVCLGVSWAIPALSRRWGRVTLHACCLLAGSVGLVSLLLMHSRYPILLSMVGVGIAWASILAIPYSLLMDAIEDGQSGVYMGLFNGFVTLPQIAMSLGFGWVMTTLLHNNRLWALALGGSLLGLAALLMLRVPEPAGITELEDRGHSLAVVQK